MSHVIVLLMGGMLLFLLRKREILSPPVVWGVACGLPALVFYLVEVVGLRPSSIADFWQLGHDFTREAPPVLGFYLGLVSLAVGADLLSRSTRRVPRRRFDPDRFFIRLLTSPVAGLVVLVLCVAIAAHFLALDFEALLHFRRYFAIRDPAEAGIWNPVLATFHTSLPLVGCALGPLTVAYAQARKPMFAAVTTAAFLYALLVTIAFGSRFAVVQLVAVGVMFQVLGRRRLDWRAALLFGLAGLTFVAIIGLRQGAGVGRIGDYGLLPFLEAIARGPALLFEGILFFALFTFFNGGFVMARALSMTGLSYPLSYKLLSFSPLPSAVDGFDQVRRFEHRAHTYAPFSNFAEAYHFGPGYLILFLLLLFVVLVALTRFWRRYRGSFAFFVLAPAYYSFLKMQSYQLRTSFRWLLVTLAVIVLVETMMRLGDRPGAARSSTAEEPAPG